ncbi:MAG: helix-turn-helix transcriptional regulator [Oscillospiraceae bacterium]|nr:helix-turn-helix transcriptional regulator [Oscillospiraceae bacterium]
MKVSYKPLWKLLIDRGIKKKDMCAMAGISPASCTKMGKDGHVTTLVLMKICMALDCRIEDVMELIPVNEQ